MRLSFGHKLAAAFSLGLLILVGASFATFRDNRALVKSTELVNTSQQTLGALDGVLSATLAAEVGSRAYAIQGNPEYRAEFDRARTEIRRNVALLATLAGADSSRVQTVRQLQRALDGRLDDMQRVTQLSRSLIAEERARLAERSAVARRIADRADRILGLTLTLAFLLAPLGYLMVRSDLAERRHVEERLRTSEARFRAATDGSMDAFYVLRAVRNARGEVIDFEFVDLNARAGALLGHPREEIIGQRLCELIPSTRTEGFFDKYRGVMEEGTALEEDFEVRNPRVHAAWIHHQVVPLRDGVAITSRDITERRQQENALRALSLIDELTGLYNRRGFLTLAQQQLKLARRGHRELLLLFIDMDDFKEINDTFGHGEGDTALRRTSDILRRTFRDSDILGRVGGDEFVVLATDSGATTTEAIMLRLRRELQERNANDGFPYRLSFSVGIARFDPDAPPSLEELMAAADSMLYEQKRFKRQTTPATA